jgi:galactose mutarotase-like enzyme
MSNRFHLASVLATGFMFASLAAAAVGEPFVQVLASSSRNVSVETWEANSRTITPNSPVPWSVRKFKLHGGKQEGVDVIVVDNGKLQVAVCPTRGMGVLWATLGDVRLGWDSPVKEIVDPRFVNLQERGGLGWLGGFNEFTCRCGLEWSGHPGTDKFVNNVGDEATMELTLHGKVANLPASEVEVVIEREAPYRIHVRGRVDERMFYGPKLEIWTDLSTEPGSSGFRIADVITNHGDAPQEFQILYHTNFGTPLLGEGATFVAAIERITPFNAHAAEGMGTYDKYAGPKLGFVEQVYKIKPAADAQGRTMALLKNAKGDRAASLAFNIKQLPYLTQWKNTNAVGEGYVTGIEPGTSFPHNRRVERQHGRVPKLAAGESRTFEIDYTIHVGEAAVKSAVDQVAAIQADRKPQVDAEPEKID